MRPARANGAAAAMPMPDPTIMQSLGFGLLVAFLFMIFSRVFELYFTSLHVPGISYRLMGLYLVLTGSLFVAFRDRIGLYAIGFTAFFLLSIPFSVWRFGSWQTLTDEWLIGLVVFLATASLITDFRQYTRAAKGIAAAILFLTITCSTRGNMDSGRLYLEYGRFSNPNEMAQALLIGMPFWWALYSLWRPVFAKVAAAGIQALMLYIISKTGSRGALIALLAIVIVMFIRASVLGKMKVLVGAALLLMLAALTLPGDLKQRYQTFFAEDETEVPVSPEPLAQAGQPDDSAMMASAVSSSAARRDMLRRSLILTLRHPLLGVGPGQFMVAEDNMERAEGKRRGAWIGTHNSFTEVSSECGIPAFLFFIGIVFRSWRESHKLYRRTRGNPALKEISCHALALNYSLVAFLVTGLFIHAAYTALLPVLAGMTMSLLRTAQPMLRQQQPTRLETIPVFRRAQTKPVPVAAAR
ncbi:MAG TPA: O-antigen ligase family protein [Bryobacteraceae bacterium]|nr:O-antigen ligase family protein [Bryobacteraceae bacterium]